MKICNVYYLFIKEISFHVQDICMIISEFHRNFNL